MPDLRLRINGEDHIVEVAPQVSTVVMDRSDGTHGPVTVSSEAAFNSVR